MAVFALAVEETNERDSVITSATPFALLMGTFNISCGRFQPQSGTYFWSRYSPPSLTRALSW